jgi:hypothetical protein
MEYLRLIHHFHWVTVRWFLEETVVLTPLRFSCRFTLNRVCFLNILINEPISKRGIPKQKQASTDIRRYHWFLGSCGKSRSSPYLGMGDINRQAMKPPSAFPSVWWSHLRAVMSDDPTQKIIYCSKTKRRFEDVISPKASWIGHDFTSSKSKSVFWMLKET